MHASSELSLMMYNEIFSSNHYGYASAVAIAIIIICLLFTFGVQFIFKKIMGKYRSDS